MYSLTLTPHPQIKDSVALISQAKQVHYMLREC